MIQTLFCTTSSCRTIACTSSILVCVLCRLWSICAAAALAAILCVLHKPICTGQYAPSLTRRYSRLQMAASSMFHTSASQQVRCPGFYV